MKKKFTEGEWIIDKKRDTVCIDILCNDEVVATCWDDYDCVDQLRANAKLIAAAPDLIEACIKLKEWNDKYPPGRIYDYSQGKAIENELTSIVKMQFEAIKKATE